MHFLCNSSCAVAPSNLKFIQGPGAPGMRPGSIRSHPLTSMYPIWLRTQHACRMNLLAGNTPASTAAITKKAALAVCCSVPPGCAFAKPFGV